MKFYLSYLPFLLFDVVYGESTECTYALEIVLVQDASGSFSKHVDTMAATSDKLVGQLADIFGEFKYGVSSFIDKPMPTRGMGIYGNYGSLELPLDYCFAEHSEMTSDQGSIQQGLERIKDHMGSGGDLPENPYEALIYAAYSKGLGWSAPDVSLSESGRPTARIALVVTDDIPHLIGDAYNGATLAWGAERTYNDYNDSKGGFGSKTWGRTPNYMFYEENTNDKAEYEEMCDLFRIGDLGGSLSSPEQARLTSLVTKFGPYPWPTIEDHPGDDSKNCNITEYPSLTQVADALNKHKITPIFLIAEPESWDRITTKKCHAIGFDVSVDCLKELYTMDLNEMGYENLVESLTVETGTENIISAIKTVTKALCLRPSTTVKPITVPVSTIKPTTIPSSPAPIATTIAKTQPPVTGTGVELSTQEIATLTPTTYTTSTTTTTTTTKRTTTTQPETETYVVLQREDCEA